MGEPRVPGSGEEDAAWHKAGGTGWGRQRRAPPSWAGAGARLGKEAPGMELLPLGTGRLLESRSLRPNLPQHKQDGSRGSCGTGCKGLWTPQSQPRAGM